MSRAQGCAGAIQLKTPYRDGTTHIIFEPLDFIARLAALVPKPRVSLMRFHGGFAPKSKYRARVTAAKQGRGGRHATTADPQERTPAERRAGRRPKPACWLSVDLGVYLENLEKGVYATYIPPQGNL